MSIDALNFLAPVALPLPPGAPEAAGAPSGQFATWFSQQLTEVNSSLIKADHGVQQLAAGDSANLHQVMIDLEHAKLSMQLVMQVRTHLLDAYRELMQMQM